MTTDWRDEAVPPRVVDAAAEHRLGALLTSARTSGLSPAMRGLGVVGLLLVVPYLAAMLGTVLGLPDPVRMGLTLIATVGGLVALILIWARSSALYLFEGGAVVARERERGVVVVPWAEMVPIETDQSHASTSSQRTFPALYINGARGRVFSCTHDEAVRLADVIASVEVRRAWAALQAGRSVVYGPMTFTTDNLVVGDTVVPWADVTRFRVGDLWIVVRGSGTHTAVELARVLRPQVPHLRTVLSLGERLATAAREPHAG